MIIDHVGENYDHSDRDKLSFDNFTLLSLSTDSVHTCVQHLNKKYDVDVPLVLMNSFNTDEDTHALLRKYSGNRVTVKSFNQV